MLEVIAVPFSNFTVDSLLYPDKFIHQFVAKLVKQLKSDSVLGVDDPDKEEAVLLKLVERQVNNLGIAECVVCYRDTSCGIGARELPWRVHRYYVKKSAGVFSLSCHQFSKVEVLHVN